MRIVHTSDWHLGRTLHGVDLSAAHEQFLSWLTALVRDERVDAVLVSGDVYDRAFPPLESVRLLESALRELTAVCPVILIPGNHDSAMRLGFGSAFYTDRLHVLARVGDVDTPVELAAGDERLLIYGLPYLDPEVARESLFAWGEPDETGEPRIARSHEAVTRAAMRAVEADLARRREAAPSRVAAVVMGHLFAVGGQSSDSERDISVGGVDCVSMEAFGEQVDYVALGHLHGPQQLHRPGSRTQIHYCGSPLAFSFSERPHRKSVTIVDFEAGCLSGTRRVPTPVVRPMSEITDTLETILSDRYADRREHWVKIVVEQETFPSGYFAQVQAVFPHALQILFHSTAPRPAAIGPSREELTPIQIAENFVAEISGRSPSQLERDVLAQAFRSSIAESA